MDPSALRPHDESGRELPQLSLRIAPLREPVSSRTLSVPSPLEPNASRAHDSNSISKAPAASGNAPANAKNEELPTVTEFLNAARRKKTDAATAESQSSVERLPKPILPAFVNLRALERFPFSSSFDDDARNGSRKRRRLDPQVDSFSEHLQLPIPQTQKEQRPPPFGPFAILNGLNEPPPNAALLPPIEAGSMTQLLSKPSRNDAAADPSNSDSNTAGLVDVQPAERREARIDEILDSTLDDNGDEDHDDDGSEKTNLLDSPSGPIPREKRLGGSKLTKYLAEGDAPLSPKTRGRSRKNLRKWTEEETTALLRGVVKCGIGNWKAILAQPEFEFNQRTASNLKDRFRVCCPGAYRASDPKEATKQLHDILAQALVKPGSDGSGDKTSKKRPLRGKSAHVVSDSNLRIGRAATRDQKHSASNISSSTPDTDFNTHGKSHHHTKSTPKKSTSSTLPQPSLASLGVPEPQGTVKSRRRSRRPFTSVEDESLLKGYAVHGFQWTLICQDPRLNLGHRKATDLRDRFRTKFPDAYRDGGSVSGKALHEQSQSQSQCPALPGSGDRDPPAPSMEHTPTKISAASHHRSETRTRHANPGPGDPALLPPPPQGFLDPSATNASGSAGMLSFSLDENTAGTSSALETPWEDNTLAPMLWDDLN
ncbi:hypothetical protein NUU61_000520 [Penicillium alfredii]|uniref:Myb-like domain-containing protein n=1 Tax=Penicillium alfredii TaxID=1506179 RepID=A0A9W9G9U0_9EURO|nr:uncharacterized protein NUU61_000520 [Penicillium alfredii]KAJ5114761.1 hypothetical protein NUU61_000520 [Penicillium alfredii]